MNAPAHIAFSLLWGGLWASAASNREVAFGLNTLTAQCALATVIGGLVVDLDNRTAPVSRALPFLSRAISRRFPHRTLMHSFMGLALSSGVVYGLLSLAVIFGLWTGGKAGGLITQFFAWGFLSHLLLDTTTRRGVPYFWPLLKNPLGYPSFEEDRIISGDRRWEIITIAVSLAGFAFLVPVIRQGADTALANAVGQLPQLREVYLNAVGQEVVLQFEGYREADKAPVSGRALILAEQDGVFTIYFDNAVRHLGQERGELRLLSGQVRQLDQPPQVRTARFFRADMAAIVADLAGGGPVLISGRLDADRPFVVSRPLDARGITASATTLEMSFAEPADMARLQVRLKADGHTATELAQAEATARQTEDSLIAVRQRTAGLYERERLFERIKAVRQERGRLEKELGEKAKEDSTARFSGQLSARVIPRF